MSLDHIEFVELAQEMIDEEGRTIVLQKLSGAAADPQKPWRGEGAPTVEAQKAVKAVFLPLQSAVDLGLFVANDDLLKKASQVAIVAHTDTDLTGFNVIQDMGMAWGVEWCKALRPGELTILYAFGVKK